MMNRMITLALVSISLLFSVNITYADVIYVRDNTTDSEINSISFVKDLQQIKDPKYLRLECDENDIAKSCYKYASYHNFISENHNESYEYFIKAFNLGMKKSGAFIAYYQMNYPEILNNNTRLNIDQTIDYLEHAFEAYSPSATRLLTVIYREPEFNRIDLKKSEYYNKIAIDQNVKTSRFLLASLYTHEMKDKSKIDESIKLYEEDLMLEKNWQSALVLMNIYLYPEDYGAKLEPDLVKTLAYAYVSSDLRDGRNENEFNSVDTRFAEAMQTELPPETLKQAKALYLEIMAKMNEERTNLDNAIPKDD